METTVTRTSYIVTAAEVKIWLRIDHTAEDSLLTNIIIPAAQASIERATGLMLSDEQVVEVEYDAEDNDGFVFLPFAPVQEITEVKVSDEVSADYTLKTGGFLVVPSGFKVSITYKAGFATPEPALKQAVLMQAAYLYNNRESSKISAETKNILLSYSRNLMI